MNLLKTSAALLALSLAGFASAQSARTWVSADGLDSAACTRSAPCATFAGAFAKTNAGGEIDVLSPGSYGPLIITNAVTIDGGSGSTTSDVLATSAGAAIAVTAGNGDVVILRNLNVFGLGTGTTGVSVTGAASVRLQRMHVSGFTGDGINIQPGSTLSVTMDDSSSNDNGGNGLYANNTAANTITAVSITHSDFSGNTNGVYAADASKITANDTNSFGNSVGFLSQASGTLSSITLYRSNAAGNAVAGLEAGDGGYPSTVRISKVAVVYNGTALVSGGNGSVYSFGDNTISGGGTIAAKIPLR